MKPAQYAQAKPLIEKMDRLISVRDTMDDILKKTSGHTTCPMMIRLGGHDVEIGPGDMETGLMYSMIRATIYDRIQLLIGEINKI